MWFEFNIVIISIFFIMRFFCYIITFKVLKYDEIFYEANPLMRKVLKCKGGEILAMIIGFLPLFVFVISNLIIQIIFPIFVWIITIIYFILLPFFIYDFLNDLIVYFKYRRVVKNESKSL